MNGRPFIYRKLVSHDYGIFLIQIQGTLRAEKMQYTLKVLYTPVGRYYVHTCLGNDIKCFSWSYDTIYFTNKESSIFTQK